MKIDYYLPDGPLDAVPRRVARARDIGYDGVFTADTAHEPFLPIVAAVPSGRGMDFGSAIAVAFARSPMVVAQTAWDLAKENLSACVEDAERYGVTLAIETVPRGFIETGAQAAQMAEEIGSPAMGVCVDIANVNAVQSPIAALEQAKERLALVHLSDNYGEHIHAPIGEGNVDFAAVANKLREIEYDGVSLLEVMTRDKVDEAFGQSKLRLEELGWQS